MSASPLPSGHSYTLWVFGILAVLAIYVATWPIVERKFSSFTTTSSTTPTGFATETVQMPPAWCSVLYFPLHLLAQRNGGENLLSHYYMWCLETF